MPGEGGAVGGRRAAPSAPAPAVDEATAEQALSRSAYLSELRE